VEIRGGPLRLGCALLRPEAIIVHCNISVAMHQSPAYLLSWSAIAVASQQASHWRAFSSTRIGLGVDSRVRNPSPAKDPI
jgi:hypothetical protein